MPTILTEKTIAANTIDPNIIQGSAFEFARGPGLVSIGQTAAATGVVSNIQAGADVVAEAFTVPVATVYPILPDNMYFAAQLQGGDRLVERMQNTTGAGIVVRAVTQLSYTG